MSLAVLITGALTGIGRAAALAFAKGATVVVSGRREAEGKALEVNFVASALKPLSFWRMCVTKTTCATLSNRPSRASVGWMLR